MASKAMFLRHKKSRPKLSFSRIRALKLDTVLYDREFANKKKTLSDLQRKPVGCLKAGVYCRFYSAFRNY